METDYRAMPYRERRLKRLLRQSFASNESRMGLPKELCRRESRIVHLLCAPAVACVLGVVAFTEMGRPLWLQAACLIQCLFWCALAGLYETASDWQRGAWLSMQSRNAKTARLAKRDGMS